MGTKSPTKGVAMKLKLRELRKMKHMSQTELAKKLEVNLRTVGAWERGETIMSAEQVWNCAEVLGTDPNELLGWYDEHPRPDSSRDEMGGLMARLSPEGREVATNVVAGLVDRYPAGDGEPGVVEGSA